MPQLLWEQAWSQQQAWKPAPPTLWVALALAAVLVGWQAHRSLVAPASLLLPLPPVLSLTLYRMYSQGRSQEQAHEARADPRG